MVLILVAQNMVRTDEGKKVYLEKKVYDLLTAFDLIKCLKQIKYHRFLLTSVTISELPSNI